MREQIYFGAIFIIFTLLLALRVRLGASARIARERRQLRIAAESTPVEWARFALLGIVPGILLSFALIYAGVILPAAVVFLLAATALLLALPRRFFSPLLLPVLAPALLFVPDHVWQQLGIAKPIQFAAPLAVFAMLYAMVAAYCEVQTPFHATPRITRAHGRRWAVLDLRQLLWVPLIVPVPGEWLTRVPFAQFVSVGHGSMSLVIIPLVLGFAFSSRDARPEHNLRTRAKIDGAFAVWAAIIAVLAMARLTDDLVSLSLLAGGSVIFALLQYIGTRGRLEFVEGAGGVRVLAVLPGTPAERMALRRGDTILTCNGQNVPTTRALYLATQDLGTFCRLRVRGADGRIRLTSAAIYTDSPYMLGIISFPEADK
ncbi:PDZ domain-containing protein [Lacticaseibacillus pabuli]|uniref:PDZ domain-containing protein n=1 Tax=Lacticaseibacillus pabuli TaxID=3025672 RepID=A0ABY7WP71_9LACO|nr:PDZ domain-containing protein [Lacticaseibacillus sp. KACC 23028]WDF81990.1 PDZ domain-containing protein [Lacticaseibacillus sp. KACC 23028]